MTALGVFIAVIISLALVRQVYRRLCLKNINAELRFAESAATEGDILTLSTVLSNAKWLPLPWVAVKFQVSRHLRFGDMDSAQISDDYYRNDLYNVLMYQRITRRFEFECNKRGYFPIKSLDVTCWDLLMDKKYVAAFECKASLTVCPSILPMPEIDELFTQIGGNIQTRRFIHPDPFTFRGIREYSPSDPLKAINFKASAKATDLMVNLWDYSVTRQVIILLNFQKQNVWHNESLDEWAIKIAASLSHRLTEMHVPVRLISDGIEVPEGVGDTHLKLLLEAFAHINLEQPPSVPFADILQHSFYQYHQEPEYWLISSYHGEELEAAYKKINGLGAKTLWILPHSDQVPAHEGFILRNNPILFGSEA